MAAPAGKKVTKQFMVTPVAGAASPKPPLGPMLGQNGVNISTFVQDFNGKTADMAAKYGPVKVPTMIYIYIDKSFDIEVFPPVTASLISWKVGGGKGSGTPNKDKKGTISMADVKEIAAIKAPVMNTEDMDAICKSIIGTAKNMGVDVK